MRTLSTYISEARDRQAGGRFNNSGSNLEDLIAEEMSKILFPTNRKITADTIRCMLSTDSDGYVIDLNMLGSRDPVQLCLFTNTVSNISRLIGILEHTRIKGKVWLNMDGFNADDAESILSALRDYTLAGKGTTVTRIEANGCGITSAGLLPKINERSSKSHRIISMNDSNITSLAGCPDCLELHVERNHKLTSLSGSIIKSLNRLDCSYCDSLKTLKGAPPAAHNAKVELIGASSLTVADGGWLEMTKGTKVIDSLSIEASVLKELSDASVWGDVMIHYLSINFDKTPAWEGIYDVIPKCEHLFVVKSSKHDNDIMGNTQGRDIHVYCAGR